MVSTWKKNQGRPQNSWKQEVTTRMREKGIINIMEKQIRRIKFKIQAQKYVKTLILTN